MQSALQQNVERVAALPTQILIGILLLGAIALIMVFLKDYYNSCTR